MLKWSFIGVFFFKSQVSLYYEVLFSKVHIQCDLILAVMAVSISQAPYKCLLLLNKLALVVMAVSISQAHYKCLYQIGARNA